MIAAMPKESDVADMVDVIDLDSTDSAISSISNPQELEIVLTTRGVYRKLALATGLSRWQVANILKGQRGASLISARKLAKALGVSIDMLERYIAMQTAK